MFLIFISTNNDAFSIASLSMEDFVVTYSKT